MLQLSKKNQEEKLHLEAEELGRKQKTVAKMKNGEKNRPSTIRRARSQGGGSGTVALAFLGLKAVPDIHNMREGCFCETAPLGKLKTLKCWSCFTDFIGICNFTLPIFPLEIFSTLNFAKFRTFFFLLFSYFFSCYTNFAMRRPSGLLALWVPSAYSNALRAEP